MHRNRKSMLVSLIVGCLSLIALMAAPSGAAAKDRNHDRIPDRWEKAHHLSLKVKQTGRDQDRDGLRNRGEFLAGDKPHDEDTDGDGTEDGDENAGTVQSFNAGTGHLVINLFNGDTLSGQVNGDTEIECEHENEAGDDTGGQHENEPGDDRLARHGENSGPSDNSGPGSEDNSGNHEGDENDEQDETSCSTTDLTEGAIVHEAELHTEGGQAVFEEIELGS